MKDVYEDPTFKNDAVVGVYALEPALLIRDPQLIKSMLIRDFDCFRDRFTGADQHDHIGRRLMIFSTYDLWKSSRTKVTHIFSTFKLKQMYSLLQKVGENLEEFLQKNGECKVYDLKILAGRFTTDSIATTVFGLNSNSLENHSEEVNYHARLLTHFNLKRAVDFLAISFAPALRRFFGPKVLFKENEEFFKKISKIVVNERECSGLKRNDIIDIFVKLKEEAKANGSDPKDFMDSIAAHMAMFMAGGYETSSSTIANCLFELAKQPKLLQRLREEIVATFVKGTGEISYEVLNSMPYLNMVMEETLRMYPVFPVLERKFMKPNNKMDDYSLMPYCDFSIPNGMGVYISTCGLNFDPQYWNNPLKFDPERFAPENRESINPMVYLPYGAGPRNCIGARLGQLQVKVGVVHMLRNHHVRVCAQTNLKPEFNGKSFILQILGGIYVEVVKDDFL